MKKSNNKKTLQSVSKIAPKAVLSPKNTRVIVGGGLPWLE